MRHVWGRAFHNVLIESLLGQPIVNKLMSTVNPIYIGRDLHRQIPDASRHLRILNRHTTTWYYLDFSGFDSSISSELIDYAWDILQSLLDLSRPIDQLVFDFSRTLFTHTPVVMPDGRLFVVHSGVPSGSYWR